MRILLTGFEAFGGDVINSSQDTIKAITYDEFADVEVVTRILPVSFKRVKETICELIDETEPDVVIMLGQSGKSDCIKLERVALNLMDSSKGDNDGYTPDEEAICPDAPPAYFTQMSVKKLRDLLILRDIPTKVSNSAGLYVCNMTYFAALHHIAATSKNTKAIFVHLPMITDKWPVERMKNAICHIINTIT